jgi:diguanylate cyclase (GGDEF)-like protein
VASNPIVPSNATEDAAPRDHDTLLGRARELVDSDLRTARQLAEQALGAAEETGDRVAIVDALLLAGVCAQRTADFGAALPFLRRARECALEIGSPARVADALQAIGSVHDDIGDYPQALDAHLQALAIYDQHGDVRARASTLRTIGIVYSKLGDARQGLDFYTQSLKLSRSAGDDVSAAKTLNNIGINRKNLGELDEAHSALKEALRLFRRRKNRAGEAGALTNLALTLEKLGRLDEAERCQREAAAAAASIGYAMAEVKAYKGLGEQMLSQHRFDAAHEVLTQALAIAERMAAAPERAQCHRALAELFKQRGDAVQALTHFEAFHRFEREVFNEQSDRKLKGLQANFQLAQAQREAEIHRLKYIELAQAHADLQALNESLRQADRTRSMLLAELERLAIEDGLTGLYNRRHLDVQLSQAFDRARREGQDLSVALADIDSFKQINDRLSHATGDEVLRTLARLLRDNVRATDLVARYGGEEFALVFHATDVSGAATICEKLRVAVEGYDWKMLHPELAVTLSIGVAGDLTVPTHDKLLAAADVRLYKAKYAGKNQVQWS